MVKPAEEERQLKDLVSIIQEDGLSALLDYAVQEGLITEPLSHTLFDGIVMWENLEGNYYEEDHDKLMLLHEQLGVTEQVFNLYREDDMDETHLWPYSTEAGDFDLELTKMTYWTVRTRAAATLTASEWHSRNMCRSSSRT